MSERSKYSKNGVYRCGNFARNLAQNTFPTVQLGSIGGINGWFIILKVEVIDNRTLVYPLINCHNKPLLNAHFFFNLLGKDGKSFISAGVSGPLFETFVVGGPKINTLAVLNENNGYLENGRLSIEYGFHIHGILGDDRIWKFNLNDKSFNPQHSLKIEYCYSSDRRLKTLYCHKQLLRFHSPLFQDEITKFQTGGHTKLLIEMCLQIAHGVRVPLVTSVLKIAFLAHNNKLRNVVQYADQQLVQHPWIPKNVLDIPMYLFSNCMKSGLRHYLAHLVNYFECLEELKEVIQKLDIEKMSGEAMKTFTAKVFELGT